MKAKLIPYGTEGQRLQFWCEGCKNSHAIPVDGSRGWQWNGDTERPTITPSIKTTYSGWDEDKKVDNVCHMYVTDGNAVYLNDCTHELAGQTIPLPNIEDIGKDWREPE